MEKIRKIILTIFAVIVVVFSILAILGIWEVIDIDITKKSLLTIGVVFFTTLTSVLILNNFKIGK